MSPEAMLRANEASFTLSLKIMDAASPVDHEITHAVKQVRREQPSLTKDLTLDGGSHHSLS